MLNTHNIVHAVIFVILILPNISNASLISTADRFWTFDETFNDSVTGLQGNAEGGASFGEDRDGNDNSALNLDGYNDRVWIDVSPDLTSVSDFTLSFWFKMNEHNSAGRTYLFDTRGPNSELPLRNYLFIYTDGTVGVSDSNIQVGNTSAASISLNDSNWHHIAFSYSALAGAMFYFDSNLLATNTSWVASDFSKGLVFGSAGSADVGGNYWLNGLLDDAGLWTSALSAEEIEELFLAEASATFITEPGTLFTFALSLIGLILINRKNNYLK